MVETGIPTPFSQYPGAADRAPVRRWSVGPGFLHQGSVVARIDEPILRGCPTPGKSGKRASADEAQLFPEPSVKLVDVGQSEDSSTTGSTTADCISSHVAGFRSTWHWLMRAAWASASASASCRLTVLTVRFTAVPIGTALIEPSS